MFKVAQIDHIHVHVSDQYEAAAWYERVLGLKILEQHEGWAIDGGPLTISSDAGNTSLALFPKGNIEAMNRSTIAFRVDGEGFSGFLKHIEENEVFDQGGVRVTRNDVSDHDQAYSIYFCDKDKNPIEVTTYEYEVVKSTLK